MKVTNLIFLTGLLLGLWQPSIEPLQAQPFTYTVTNDSAGGTGSLRWAIMRADSLSSVDTIKFNIPGNGPFTIRPTAPLPTITVPVVIDGYSQPGASPNTNPPTSGTNAAIMIEIDGSLAGSGASGLHITAGGSTVRGLAIYDFDFVSAIFLDTGNANVVEGCFLGPDASGTSGPGNRRGILIVESDSNRIGGSTPAARNVISANDYRNISVGGPATGNLIQGNLIGSSVAGSDTLGNNGIGVLFAGADDNLVGGSTPAERNVIVGSNILAGVVLAGNANRVQGNYIGTDVSGTLAPSNAGDGVYVTGSVNNLIGGSASGEGNIISGNVGNGIQILGPGAAGNNILGNFIGTDVSGSVNLGNGGSGIYIEDASNTAIGGAVAGAGNLISGNAGEGIHIMGALASANSVRGNFIGTDVAGSAAIGNANAGVLLNDAPSNTVGGISPTERNLISGNLIGIVISASNATNNTVIGNYIGTDASGTVAVGNSNHGIFISACTDNTIGGTTAAERNLISGNAIVGVVLIDSAYGNSVMGNYVGTDVSGMSALPNFIGVHILGAAGNTIGGSLPGAGNLLSGNINEGLLINGALSTANVVQGNLIGTDATGSGNLGNNGNGVRLDRQPDYPSSNLIGGFAPAEGNVIAYNNGDGVVVAGGSGNGVLSNSIYANGGIGIDLGDNFSGTDNVTPNDPGDADSGANNLQNFPVVTFVLSDTAFIAGTLNSTPNTNFTLQFFSNPVCDPSDYGEVETLVGTSSVTTDSLGNASLSYFFPGKFNPGE